MARYRAWVAWTFTRPRASQAVLTSGIVAVGLAGMAAPGADEAWAAFVQGVPEWCLVVAVPTALHHTLYWSLSGFFHRVDTTNRPAWVARRRIQDGRPRRPPLRRVLRNLAWNQLLIAPLMMVVIWGCLRMRGWAPSRELPGTLEVAWQLIALAGFSEVYF
ncbi:MAG: hypothetical protein VX265_01170, partial [Myxococcota bacterium]|nr:hypothetical protein [Myxococcota bacterium]